jgi:hypothetical protein
MTALGDFGPADDPEYGLARLDKRFLEKILFRDEAIF